MNNFSRLQRPIQRNFDDVQAPVEETAPAAEVYQNNEMLDAIVEKFKALPPQAQEAMMADLQTTLSPEDLEYVQARAKGEDFSVSENPTTVYDDFGQPGYYQYNDFGQPEFHYHREGDFDDAPEPIAVLEAQSEVPVESVTSVPLETLNNAQGNTAPTAGTPSPDPEEVGTTIPDAATKTVVVANDYVDKLQMLSPDPEAAETIVE